MKKKCSSCSSTEDVIASPRIGNKMFCSACMGKAIQFTWGDTVNVLIKEVALLSLLKTIITEPRREIEHSILSITESLGALSMAISDDDRQTQLSMLLELASLCHCTILDLFSSNEIENIPILQKFRGIIN